MNVNLVLNASFRLTATLFRYTENRRPAGLPLALLMLSGVGTSGASTALEISFCDVFIC